MRDYGGQAVGRYYATVAQLVEHFIRNLLLWYGYREEQHK